MHNALRVDENPALDVAAALARQNGLPLLVYHGLSEKYPYASDRHHAFILQGVREVQREMSARGIAFAFHLERDGNRGPHLRDLTRRAAALVTETMPVAPLAQWTERLRSITTTPIVSVDTACLLPLSLLARLAASASGVESSEPVDLKLVDDHVCHPKHYRALTASTYPKRIDSAYSNETQWSESDDGLPLPFQGSLGFDTVDLQDVCLAKLIGQCRIDHTIAPVADSPGGSLAGYARWDEFRKQGLLEYNRKRSHAEDPQCGCRMSAYLHYGMVSPFRIAREASQAQSELGNDQPVRKFLDEFLVWREMAFHFCSLHADQLDTLAACPDWAVASLHDHAGDVREQTYDWESLARGKTQSALWNAAQRSLLRHGELPNDLRMPWGKEFLTMTGCPAKALCYLIDLNHRYALDGRSASSYGGMLWCMGQFDRPFEPPTPVFGNVRRMSIEDHAKRLDADRFSLRSDRAVAQVQPRVAVIGAGIGGLMAARTIADHGLDVHVFDKARGVGGRMATRRHHHALDPHGGGGEHRCTPEVLSFDHGAQYFTVRDDRFARYVRSWIEAGHAAAWMGRIVELRPGGEVVAERRSRVRYVGTPAMNSITKHLAGDLSVSLRCPISRIDADGEAWKLLDREEQPVGVFDAVIVNCPPQQAAPLLAGHTELTEIITGVEMLPCFALMLQCEGIADLPFAGGFVNEGPLRWIARNDGKPGRSESHVSSRSNWVLHASPEWSQAHLETDEQTIEQELIMALEQLLGRKLGTIYHAIMHRWRFANTKDALPQPCLWDSTTKLGACGDWCGSQRVEGAFLSGAAVAGAFLRQVTIDRPAVEMSRIVPIIG